MKVPGWCAACMLIVGSFQPQAWGRSTAGLREEQVQAAQSDTAARQAELRVFALAPSALDLKVTSSVVSFIGL
jgi:hypothetical protein